MHELSYNLVLGIVSGLLTTLLVVVLRKGWLGIVIPWFEEMVYKDAKIEGDWFGSDSDEPDELNYVVKIVRNGHRVHGTLTAPSGADKGKSWTFEGTFRNLILTAIYGSADSTRLDRGSITLMLVQDGERLLGKMAFYSDTDHAIEEGDLVLGRDAAAFNDKVEVKMVPVLMSGGKKPLKKRDDERTDSTGAHPSKKEPETDSKPASPVTNEPPPAKNETEQNAGGNGS